MATDADGGEDQGEAALKRRRLDEAGNGDAVPEAATDAGRLAAFGKWARRVPGLDLGSVELRHDAGGLGWGLYAKRVILPGQLLVRLPFSLCVDGASVAADKTFQYYLKMWLTGAHGCHSCGHTPPRTIQVLLYLIFARHNSNTFQHGFLQMCPSTFEDLRWWSDDELQMLQGSSVYYAAVEERLWLMRHHERYVKPLAEAEHSIMPPGVFTLTALRWARSLWRSRVFPRVFAGYDPADGWDDARISCGLGSGAALLPVVDFCNHRPGTNVHFVVDNSGSALEFRLPDDAPEIAEGDQVWGNYGAKSDEEWLLNYGFIPTPLSDLDESARYANSRVEFFVQCRGPRRPLAACLKELFPDIVSAGKAVKGDAYADEAMTRVGPFVLRVEDTTGENWDRVNKQLMHFAAAFAAEASPEDGAGRARAAAPNYGAYKVAFVLHLLRELRERLVHGPAATPAAGGGRGALAERYLSGQAFVLDRVIDKFESERKRYELHNDGEYDTPAASGSTMKFCCRWPDEEGEGESFSRHDVDEDEHEAEGSTDEGEESEESEAEEVKVRDEVNALMSSVPLKGKMLAQVDRAVPEDTNVRAEVGGGGRTSSFVRSHVASPKLEDDESPDGVEDAKVRAEVEDDAAKQAKVSDKVSDDVAEDAKVRDEVDDGASSSMSPTGMVPKLPQGQQGRKGDEDHKDEKHDKYHKDEEPGKADKGSKSICGMQDFVLFGDGHGCAIRLSVYGGWKPQGRVQEDHYFDDELVGEEGGEKQDKVRDDVTEEDDENISEEE